MKQNRKEQRIQENMQAGRLAKDGFLGEDNRPVQDIIEDDLAMLSSQGYTKEDVAAAMRALTKKGLETPGVPVDWNGYTITVEEYMGYMGCPFRHNRRAAKRNTEVTDVRTGKIVSWSDMVIHLIDDHGFFQGIGSPYRLEPLELAKFLKL